jgi:DNA polymerase III epsilon subunit-like protein
MTGKILYLDCETTGLKPEVHDIIELAYIIEVDGEVKERACLNMQPFSYENIDRNALQISGHTVEQLKTFSTPENAYRLFTQALGRHCDKFDKADKFYPSGFNAGFDLEFINQFFLKNGDKYFGSWMNWRTIDPRPILIFLNYMGKIHLPKYNLEEACKHFGITLTSHDAASDIEATRLLLHKLTEIFGTVTVSGKGEDEKPQV